MLLREAYRRGLDRDAVVRQHLVQKMRFILGEDEAAPTEAELRAYLAANRERYRSPPTVTLDQVFYADPAKVPDDLMAQLQNGTDIGDLGDPLDMLGNRLPRYSLRDLIGLMGPDVARRVFELPAGAWHGPLQSERGVHFVRVEQHHPPSHAELRRAGGLSAPGLDFGPATAGGRGQARRAAPELPHRGRPGRALSLVASETDRPRPPW